MSGRKTATASKRAPGRHAARKSVRPAPGANRTTRNIVVVAVVLGILVIVLLAGRSGSNSAKSYPFQVGNPGPGQTAPDVRLPATDGSTFDLASARGRNVLLYFQEGVGCQGCWDQITDIQRHRGEFAAAGVDDIVSITTNSLSPLRQKVSDEGVTIPVLSDSDLAVSERYHANSFGMMGQGADGHSFVLVGPDGRVRWRADYGGAPNYTMYVPVQHLVADLRRGIAKGSA